MLCKLITTSLLLCSLMLSTAPCAYSNIKDQQHPPSAAPIKSATISTTTARVQFTPAELEYLRHKQRITMGVDPDWLPFENISSGRHFGIAADYMALFQKQLPIPIILVPTDSWQATIECAKQRRCDILSLAASTPSRLHYMDFTPAYLSIPVVIATTMDKIYINNVETILNKKIGIVRGYALAEEMRTRFPGCNVINVDSIQDGLHKVESGELFCYIDNLMVIADQIQKNFTGSIKVSGRLDEGVNQVNLAVGTRNDEPLLHSIFTKLVTSVTPVERKTIMDRWSPVTTRNEFDYQLLWTLLATFLGLGALFGYHYRQLKKYNSLLRKLSETDKLTELYNRCKLDEILQEKFDTFARYNTNCGVAILDIDHFKQVNDTFGHLTGDKVLIKFATVLSSNVRATDVVGRWGGEEFLIIAPYSDVKETTKLAEKLLEQLRATQFPKVGRITASCGVSAFTEGKEIQNTVRIADEALYRAKAGGRDQVISSSMQGNMRR